MFVLSRRMTRLYASLLGAAVSSAALADPGGLPAEIQALRVKVETIQSQQTSAQAQLASLLSAVNSLTAAGNSLQTAITSLASADVALQTKITGLQSSVSFLQATSTTLSGQVAALQAANSSLSATAISRGSVLFNGSIVSGSGFLVLSDQDTGRYEVVYTTPRFTATPSCVVSAQQGQQPAEGANYYCKLDRADAAGLTVQCYAPPSLAFSGNFASFVRNATSVGNFQFICAQ